MTGFQLKTTQARRLRRSSAMAMAWMVLALSPVAAHLPGQGAGQGDGARDLGLAPMLRSQIATRSKSAADRFRTTGWRCEATCDASGHVRQRCLMLEDPRLSGLGQALDHLSKSATLTKTLDDLGLDPQSQGPTC